jgi:hypothetical protein
MLSERIASVFMITSSVSAKLSEFCYPELKAIESISCKIGPDATASQAGAAIVARLQPATAVRVGTGLAILAIVARAVALSQRASTARPEQGTRRGADAHTR